MCWSTKSTQKQYIVNILKHLKNRKEITLMNIDYIDLSLLERRSTHLGMLIRLTKFIYSLNVGLRE